MLTKHIESESITDFYIVWNFSFLLDISILMILPILVKRLFCSNLHWFPNNKFIFRLQTFVFRYQTLLCISVCMCRCDPADNIYHQSVDKRGGKIYFDRKMILRWNIYVSWNYNFTPCTALLWNSNHIEYSFVNRQLSKICDRTTYRDTHIVKMMLIPRTNGFCSHHLR